MANHSPLNSPNLAFNVKLEYKSSNRPLLSWSKCPKLTIQLLPPPYTQKKNKGAVLYFAAGKFQHDNGKAGYKLDKQIGIYDFLVAFLCVQNHFASVV